MQSNRVLISGKISEIGVPRRTPAGLPVLSFNLGHSSEQVEAGAKRQVQCEVAVMAVGEVAECSLKAGDNVTVQGFLARRSMKSTQLVLHANKIELTE